MYHDKILITCCVVLYSHLNFEYMKEADRRSNTFLDVIQIPIDVDWNLEKTSQRVRDISYMIMLSTALQIK